jgi:predicted transcriptional regulator
MDTESLRNIGLTEGEAKTYLAVLELGSTTKGPIVERAGVASSKIYELLDKLLKKGLVSQVIRSGVRYYESAPPARLLDYVEVKKETLREQEKAVKVLIPQLEVARSLAGIGSETQVFKGMNGAKTSFDDILRTLKPGDAYYVIGISKFPPAFERFVIHFHEERAKQGIKCTILVNEMASSIGEQLARLPLTTVAYLGKELFTPVVFIVYRDKTLISIALDEVFIQIRSKNLADGLNAYARYLFSIARKSDKKRKTA